MSDAIFIAGYYRSGTSALSGALQRLGVTLHNDAAPNEHNPLGFYEIPELIEFDVELFARLGSEWTDIRGLPEGWQDRADMASFLSRLGEILRRRFSADVLWGIKHPHLCRLFPLYERAAGQAGHKLHVIHIARDPWTVAASQQRKNRLSRAHALLLWVSYLVSAERHARHLPRSWLTYQDLLAQPAAQFKRIEQDLGLTLRERTPNGLKEAKSFLTTQLNRSEPLPQETLSRPLRLLVDRVWDAVLSRDAAPGTWDGFGSECAEIVGLVAEMGESGGPVVPGIGNFTPGASPNAPERIGLRPAERLDDGAKQRLLARRDAAPVLPTLAVLIAAPPSRAHAINETLESLRAQWHEPALIKIVSVDPVELPGLTTVSAPAEAGALTRILCAELNAVAETADYVALLNAGDTIAPDGCLRFALEAVESWADLIYCDEVVPRDDNPWVRHKPGWDITRLRQAAYLGDWVWYRAETLHRLGGFDAAYAGAEEYDYQLRLAETEARVVRLPETLFTRAAHSRRDNIPATEFGARAVDAVTAHLARAGIPATVQSRQQIGLFEHQRVATDPGTSFVLLCDGAQIPQVDQWLRGLLTEAVLTGPIVLAGTDLTPEMTRYLTQVTAQTEALQGKVLAVPPASGLKPAEALRQALTLAPTEHVAILDARAQPAAPQWQEALRSRLADPGVALAGARTLIPLTRDSGRFTVQGPIVIGADTRLGAGHMSDDPGPGGWLVADQEASAVTPPALLARRAVLAACAFPDLAGDALWTDLCAQIRARGERIVWTPDVSFVAPPASIRVDPECGFRAGTPAARALAGQDPYHSPALSLRGDLLRAEQRLGLVRAAPADPSSLLLCGPADTGIALLNAVRALRAGGRIEAGWVPDHLTVGEICRSAPSIWVRINPETPAPVYAPPYTAVFTRAPAPAARDAIAGAVRLIASSPALVQAVRDLAPPGQQVALWRPALSRPVWEDFRPAAGLNSNPRVLWIDEGIAPAWLKELIDSTASAITWIVVGREQEKYAGSVARLRRPEAEQGWARELGAVAPHILVRPADADTSADQYTALLAAAAGCHLLVDERLDMPTTLGAVRLPNQIDAWRHALVAAVADLQGTLACGQKARAACLALQSVEEAAPIWAEMVEVGNDQMGTETLSAAE